VARGHYRGTLAPLGSILALGVFARDAGPEALAYVLTGNVVLNLMFENLDKVSGHFAFMKAVGTINYFATLPSGDTCSSWQPCWPF